MPKTPSKKVQQEILEDAKVDYPNVSEDELKSILNLDKL